MNSNIHIERLVREDRAQRLATRSSAELPHEDTEARAPGSDGLQCAGSNRLLPSLWVGRDKGAAATPSSVLEQKALHPQCNRLHLLTTMALAWSAHAFNMADAANVRPDIARARELPSLCPATAVSLATSPDHLQ